MTEQASSTVVRKKSELWGWIRFLLVLALVYLIVNNLTGLMRVSGQSMEPTLQHGDILLINKASLFVDKPKYGDVVVVEEESLGYKIVKRVIAVEGDTVAIVDGVTFVNGEQLVELYTYGKSEDMEELTVGAGQLFVVGDNRTLGESLDSRSPSLGPIAIGDVKGYVAASLWPMHGIAKPLDLN
ncbi:signal peptidase I [Paenibacillus sp. PL2-23]|uniref:signal peptidase I n=1 Tax=Paenibacillus sp. PL2-23 TaxID=2100729 RepID=UPI0030F9815A